MKRPQGILTLILLVFSLFTRGAEASMILCVEANGRIVLADSSDLCCVMNGVSSNGSTADSNQAFSVRPESSCDSCFDIPLLTGENQQPIDRANRVQLPALDPVVVSSTGSGFLNFSDSLMAQVFPEEPCEISLPRLRTVVLRF